MKYRPLSTLSKLKDNPRKIDKTSLERLTDSIKKFPNYFEARPLILSNRTGELVIIGGNQRYKVAKKLKLKEVPTHLLEDLTEEQEKEIAIRDNINNGDWDYDILAMNYDIGELEDYGVYIPDDLRPEEEIEEDEVPEVSDEEPISKLGEVYQLGRHRLMCGSATDVDNVKELMSGRVANLVFTDPPYGISVVTGGKVGADFGVAKKGKYSDVIGDDTIETAKDFYNTFVSLGIDRFIIWGGNYFTSFLPQSDGWLIWDKRGDSGIRNTFADGEMAWCSFHTPVRIYKQLWNGMIREGEKDKRVHPTQKPLQTLSSILKDFTKENDIVVDVFGGSGSILIACEQTDRTCFMMELDPKYCDVIRKRYENYTLKSRMEQDAK